MNYCRKPVVVSKSPSSSLLKMPSNLDDLPMPDFSDTNLRRLKEKYSNEMRDCDNNPMKICMKLIVTSATEKDPQKRSDLSLKLSEFLTEPNGVMNLFLALIDFDTSSQVSTTHNQRFIAISNIITCLPKLCLPYDEYCRNIFIQLKPLLVTDQSKYSTLACIVVKSMFDSPHAKTAEEVSAKILDIVFGALRDPVSNLFHPTEAILAINNMLQNHLPAHLFVVIFPHLFHCMLLLNRTPSRLKPILKTCLVNILNSLEAGVASCLLEKTMFFSERVSHQFQLELRKDGEITLKVCAEGDRANRLEIGDITDIIVSLLEGSNDSLILEFYFHFHELMWSAKDDYSRRTSAHLTETLLLETVEEKSSKLDLISIIAMNSEHSIELISRTLLRYVVSLRTGAITETDSELVRQSMTSCLTILEVLYASNLAKKNRSFEEKFIPLLEELLVLLSKRDELSDLHHSVSSITMRLRSIARESNQVTQKSPNRQTSKDYDEIVNELNDKLEPVRAHALVRLKQMIMTNDEFVVARISELYQIVETSLNDPEPYVYLSAINLVVEMALKKTDSILSKLIDIYTNENLELQCRINVGEVLVRITKQMNEVTPFYSRLVLDTLFDGCRNPEELMRISSLTNLGEICKNLNYSLGTYIVRILNLVEGVIESDTIDVKCAAIDLLRTTMLGLDRLKLESVQGELKSMYNLLKRVKYRTLDSKINLQLDLTLDEMDRLVRELILGNSTSGPMVKEIKVLSLLNQN